MWCLVVIRSYPDYKRPFSTTDVQHFATYEKAFAEKEKAYDEFLDESGFEREEYECDPNIYYCDTYMEMPPFEARLFEVKI